MIRKLILLLAACCICSIGWSAPANCPTPEVFKVKVCHIPPDDPLNKHEITITSNSMSAHLAHGDTVGACVVVINCNDGICRQECLDNCILPPPPPPICESSNKCFTNKLINNTCTLEAVNCDDGSLCTSDSCDPATGCVTTKAITCDDNSKCTEDTCNPATGLCVYANIECGIYGCHDPSYGCDGDPCEGKTCLPSECNEAGQCVIGNYSTEEGKWITSCSTGPTFSLGTSCNDGNQCTLTDTCNEGVCAGAPIPPTILISETNYVDNAFIGSNMFSEFIAEKAWWGGEAWGYYHGPDYRVIDSNNFIFTFSIKSFSTSGNAFKFGLNWTNVAVNMFEVGTDHFSRVEGNPFVSVNFPALAVGSTAPYHNMKIVGTTTEYKLYISDPTERLLATLPNNNTTPSTQLSSFYLQFISSSNIAFKNFTFTEPCKP
jgi:hypothetical protein